MAAVDDEASWAYYRTRPRGSQIGAWASHQSARDRARGPSSRPRWPPSRSGSPASIPPLPPHWGGYRLTPDVYEFWTHDDARLHDRVVYRRAGDGWARELLSP